MRNVQSGLLMMMTITRVPACLWCVHKQREHVEGEQFLTLARRHLQKQFDVRRQIEGPQRGTPENCRFKTQRNTDYGKINGLKVGNMFRVDEIMNHHIEDDLLFRNMSKRVPPVGPQELHLFVDRPMDAFATSIKDNPSFYCRESHSSYAPGALRINSGMHLRVSAWLNDDIIQAYTAPCNAITEHNKNCFFLGPCSAIGWDDERAFIKRVRSDMEKTKKIKTKVACDVHCGYTNNRSIYQDELFAMGYKAVCVVFNIHKSHWCGVHVSKMNFDTHGQPTCNMQFVDASEEPEKDQIDCMVNYVKYKLLGAESPDEDEDMGHDDTPGKRQERVLKEKVALRYQSRGNVRDQKDSTSCGVQQCHVMSELATGIPSWAQTSASKHKMELYRLAIARRLMNFDGHHREEFRRDHNVEHDLHVPDGKTKKKRQFVQEIEEKKKEGKEKTTEEENKESETQEKEKEEEEKRRRNRRRRRSERRRE